VSWIYSLIPFALPASSPTDWLYWQAREFQQSIWMLSSRATGLCGGKSRCARRRSHSKSTTETAITTTTRLPTWYYYTVISSPFGTVTMKSIGQSAHTCNHRRCVVTRACFLESSATRDAKVSCPVREWRQGEQLPADHNWATLRLPECWRFKVDRSQQV